MTHIKPDAIRKQLLAGALSEYESLGWYVRARRELGENWDSFATVARELEEEGLVERNAFFDSFSLRLRSRGKDYCDENGIS